MLKDMWQKLNTYTVSAMDGTERAINVRNEWGGYSRRLGMPVFTGWQDHIASVDGQTRALICDTTWQGVQGVNNQEHWVEHALNHGGQAAFFVIKAIDATAVPRKVEWLDDTRVLCGKVVRVGTKSFVISERIVPL